MRVIGDPIFACDETGRLKTRIGTIFLRSRVLITLPGIHATQRLAWIEHLKRERQVAKKKLTDEEINQEMEQSVDLLFSEQHVLIRPEPETMALAFEADRLLQEIITKSKIRFLNVQNKQVRNALRARGENWRMSRLPISQEEMIRLVADSLVPIAEQPIFFYNQSTGTRYLTVENFAWLKGLSDHAFRQQMLELKNYCCRRNRHGYPEVDIFPRNCTFDCREISRLDVENLDIATLRRHHTRLVKEFRAAVSPTLRYETPLNIEWRNNLCSALTTQPNDIVAESITDAMSPEFYNQIEWLPGCRLEQGKIIFDPVLTELEQHGHSDHTIPYDPRAKAIIFNYLREHDTIEYINIGHIGRSLSHRLPEATQRASVYVVHLKELNKAEPELLILRFQKWGVKEHLDAGKPLLQAIMESINYTDYVLDRRLGCRQLAMNLTERLSASNLMETYHGQNEAYHGTQFWTVYFERYYVQGRATDKILNLHYADSEFNRRLARLLGEAAASNAIVGRADLHKKVLFDDGDEVLVNDADGLPLAIVISDHTGAFTKYREPLLDDAPAYALPVNRRLKHMTNKREFMRIYLRAFQARLEQTQRDYQQNPAAYDHLFSHRPLDSGGSFAYRWKCTLRRLTTTDASELTNAIRQHIQVP